MPGSRIIVRAAAMLALAAGPLLAQDTTSCFCPKRRASGTASVVSLVPVGALKKNIDATTAFGGAFLLRLGHAGKLSLRMDLAYVEYAEESKTVALSETIGGRIRLKVPTSYVALPFTVGPQLSWGTGRFRPYVNAGIGGTYFTTESHVEGLDDPTSFGQTTNYEDTAFAWGAGAGVNMPLWNELISVALDVSAQYVNGGESSYLKPGGIIDRPNGEVQFAPLTTSAKMMLFRFGLKVGFP